VCFLIFDNKAQVLMNTAIKFPAYKIAKIIQYSGHRQYSQNHIADQNSIAKNATNLATIRKRSFMLAMVLCQKNPKEKRKSCRKSLKKLQLQQIFSKQSICHRV
jgi:hypothetical protein